MIAKGMPVQIRRSGTSVPVERLEIGDLVYDPLIDNYIEIIDILSRKTTGLGDALTLLPAGRLGPDKPRRDLLVSRQQPIGRIARLDSTAPARLEFEAACRLGEEHMVPSLLFALFCERPGCISVAGAVLRVFDPSSLDRPDSHQASPSRMGQSMASALLRKATDSAAEARRRGE
jgi:hypothetical protein